jgi:hypothetical protein
MNINKKREQWILAIWELGHKLSADGCVDLFIWPYNVAVYRRNLLIR